MGHDPTRLYRITEIQGNSRPRESSHVLPRRPLRGITSENAAVAMGEGEGDSQLAAGGDSDCTMKRYNSRVPTVASIPQPQSQSHNSSNDSNAL